MKLRGDEAWQTNGLRLVQEAVEALWRSAEGEQARKWLEGRGLTESTLRTFLVGWSTGMRQGGLYAPKGVTLPCLEGEVLWSIKIALTPEQMTICQSCRKLTRARHPCAVCGTVNKYRAMRGGHPALFNAGELRPGVPALFVEGEFDCMAAWQTLRDEMAVVTLGSASAAFDLRRWGAKLMQASRVYTLLDNDEAGEKGRETIRLVTGGTSVDLRLPKGVKDVNEFVLGGGDLREVVRD
jgi:DNA primase